ncbi:hypothetical protein [Phytohalomonas tamaricis]|uniref:hypothetical protein n=1 Tax=Phytohalomonas tamaricis TaxID=2081032 RepID=UPI000D0AC708|nr:hypothetical protein [Phytohalomonas tamaricis]
MKTLLILVVILFIAMAPVIAMRPSLHQRRQIALRDEARRQGFRVAIEKTPWLEDSLSTVAYRLHYPRELQGPRFALINAQEGDTPGQITRMTGAPVGWKSVHSSLTSLSFDKRSAVETLLKQLPKDIRALESDARALTLWWDETLDAAAFAILAEQLKVAQARLTNNTP